MNVIMLIFQIYFDLQRFFQAYSINLNLILNNLEKLTFLYIRKNLFELSVRHH
jgi:hypothetical protein